jgi:hypothetical protein
VLISDIKIPKVRYDENPFADLKLLCADKCMDTCGEANTHILATLHCKCTRKNKHK